MAATKVRASETASEANGDDWGLDLSDRGHRWLFATLVCLGALAFSGRANGESTGEKISGYAEAAWKEFDTQENPTWESSEGAIERLERAELLGRSRGAYRAQAQASLYAGRAYDELGPDFSERSIEKFEAATVAAARAGDARIEIDALGGMLDIWHQDIKNAEVRAYFNVLRRLIDIAASSGNMFDAIQAIERASRSKNEDIRKRLPATAIMPLMAMDTVAEARLTGDYAPASRIIKRLPGQKLPLLAGHLAEKIGDPTGLKKVVSTHRNRGDATAELRVRRRLLAIQSKGKPTEKERAELYALALTAKDYKAAADFAGDAQAAASLRQMAKLYEQESDEMEGLPAWQREGRRPNENDAFVEAIIAGIEPHGGVSFRGALVEIAHIDGSRAFVPMYFDILNRDPDTVRGMSEDSAIALAELARPEDIPQLAELLDHDSWIVRRTIAFGLAKFAGKDERIVGIFEERLAKDENAAVKAVYRYGLIKAGIIEPHLQQLKEQMTLDNDQLQITAAVALFDLGYGMPHGVIAKYSSDKMAVKNALAPESLAELLGNTTNPEAIPYLERFMDNPQYPYEVLAARSLNRFDTPRARAARGKRIRRNSGLDTEYLWYGLRDARRGRIDPESLVALAKHGKKEIINSQRFTKGDAIDWITGEASGDVKFGWTPDYGDKYDREKRAVMAKNAERKPYPKFPGKKGKGVKKSIQLKTEDKRSIGLLSMTLRPVARLIDGSTVVVNLNKEQFHSGVHIDQLAGPLWINFDLRYEAEGALRQTSLEGVAGAGGPIVSTGGPMFDLPEDMPPGGLRGATFVVDIKFFDKEKRVTFPLNDILIRTEHDRPDLVVSDVGIDPNPPRPGEHADISFSVKNVGHQPSGAVTLDVYVHNVLRKPQRRKIATKKVPRLVPGEWIEMGVGGKISADRYMGGYAPGWTPESRDTSIELEIDAGNAVEEVNEKNNTFMLPVVLVLTDEEQSTRLQEELLAKLKELAERLEAMGEDAPAEALQTALGEMLDALDGIVPRTPGIQRARSLVKMLHEEAQARDKLKDALDKIKALPPAFEEEDVAKIAADLLAARGAFLDSGTPVKAEHIDKLKKDLEEFRELFGDEIEPLDPEKNAYLDKLQADLDEAKAWEEAFGGPTPEMDPEYENMLGPDTDNASREAALKFLNNNDAWNETGVTMAETAYDQLMSGDEPPELEEIRKSFENAYNEWEANKPPGTEAQVDAINTGGEGASAAEEPTERGARAALKALGW